MSTILIYTSPARGHLYPVMDIAFALRAAGHRVIVKTLSDECLHAANLRAAVKQARECGGGAQRVAAGFKAAGGAKRAVRILETLLT